MLLKQKARLASFLHLSRAQRSLIGGPYIHTKERYSFDR